MLVAAFSISRRATMFAVWHPANKGCAVLFLLYQQLLCTYKALDTEFSVYFCCTQVMH